MLLPFFFFNSCFAGVCWVNSSRFHHHGWKMRKADGGRGGFAAVRPALAVRADASFRQLLTVPWARNGVTWKKSGSMRAWKEEAEHSKCLNDTRIAIGNINSVLIKSFTQQTRGSRQRRSDCFSFTRASSLPRFWPSVWFNKKNKNAAVCWEADRFGDRYGVLSLAGWRHWLGGEARCAIRGWVWAGWQKRAGADLLPRAGLRSRGNESLGWSALFYSLCSSRYHNSQ